MRPVLLAAAILMVASPGLAQERRVPLPAAPKGVPSIMVDPGAPAASAREAPAAQERRKTGKAQGPVRKPKPAPRIVRRAPLPVPTTGTPAIGAINRSLEIQGQQMRAQDQRQFELNQIRSGSGGSLGCAPGSLGC